MTSNRVLFPGTAARRRAESRLTDVLMDVSERRSSRSVSPSIDLPAFRSTLARLTFDRPQDLDGLVDWTVASLEQGVVQMTHPGYFGLFNPAPVFPAECADRIAAAFNPQICVWSHAPVAVEIESHVIETVALRAGLPKGSGGHFTSGGSEANGTALTCALTAAEPDFAAAGTRAYSGPPRLYASMESHLAWLKIAHASGLGRDAVRLVSTDGRGRMDPDALAQAIEADHASGDVAVMIAATAGTTNAGMVDPLEACAEIAARHGLWYHIDAAWGGALISSPEHRVALRGLERADSVTIDAHKWFATTMGAGMFLTRHKGVLSEAFNVTTRYMPDSNVVDDLYVNSLQWSRRFVGLRLFLALGAAGWTGYADHVRHSIDLIEYLIAGLAAKGWAHVNASPMAVACLVPPEGSGAVDAYVERVLATGRSWVSATRFEDQAVLRACVTNGRTTSADIDRLIDTLA